MVDSATPDQVVADPAISARYRVIETLAPGSRRALYLAQRLDTGALTELLILADHQGADEALVKALRQHATLVDSVARYCPGIGKVYECGRTSGGALLLAMERPEGPTLRDAIRLERRLDIHLALRLAIQIAEVLERAHNVGVVHGGLRPENLVLVGPVPTVVLTHFGFDWLLASRSSDARTIDSAAPAESVYQAPEQASGQAVPQSDVYALGVILYEMLVGAPPPTGMALRRHAGPGPLRRRQPSVSRGLESLVMQALDVVPDRRPEDISVLCNYLWGQITLHGKGAGEFQVPGVNDRTKRIALRAALAVIGVVAIGLGYAYVTSDGAPAWKTLWRSAPAAVGPPTAAAPSAAGGADRSGPSDEAGGANTRRSPGAPAPDTRAAGRSPDKRDNEKVQAASPAPASVAPRPPRPAGPPTVTPTAPVQPPSQTGDEPSAQRAKGPAASRPGQSRERTETDEDPSAVIDWLLREGARP